MENSSPSQSNVAPPATPPPMQSDPTQDATPWGFWMTLLFSSVVLVTIMAGQMIVNIIIGIYGAAYMSEETFRELTRYPMHNGLLLSLTVLLNTPIGIGWILLFVILKPGVAPWDYLALSKVGWNSIAVWVAAVLALDGIVGGLRVLAGLPFIPEYMAQMNETAYFRPMFWFVVVFIKPIFEETYYRGFMFRGFQQSPIGATGAILLTAFLSCALLFQYDFSVIAGQFAYGILAGIARYRTGSLFAGLAMHGTSNLLSVLTSSIYFGAL